MMISDTAHATRSGPIHVASALSEHPLAAHAVGEVTGALLERMNGLTIDLVVAFVDSAHTGAIEDIGAALNDILLPQTLIGSTACGVLERDYAVENRSAIAVWAGAGFDVRPIRLTGGVASPEDGFSTFTASHAIILADPFSSPVEALLAEAAQAAPQMAIHGGLASGARGPGGNRLLLDREVFSDGAIGVTLDGVPLRSAVSHGCRPVGSPFTVTDARSNIVTELAFKKPLDVLQEIVDKAGDRERALLANGVHVGIVIDEARMDFTGGDFLIRSITGADRSTGAIAVGAEIPVGTTLQFHVRDATTATEDLLAVLDDKRATAALTFSCNGRGERLFGRSSHDAELIHELTNSAATCGMFCAGEFGPVRARNHLHGFTASTLLFG